MKLIRIAAMVPIAYGAYLVLTAPTISLQHPSTQAGIGVLLVVIGGAIIRLTMRAR